MTFEKQPLYEHNDFLVLDIGAFRIKGALFSISGSELVLEHTHMLKQNRKDVFGGEITDLSSITEQIKKVIAQIEQKSGKEVKNILLGINSNRFLYDITGISYVRKSDLEPINMNEVDQMLDQVEERSFEKIAPLTESRFGNGNIEMKLVTTIITSVTLDGKKVVNPIGFTGKQVKIQVLNVFVPLYELQTYTTILRNLGKHILSIIPIPAILPKLTERHPSYLDANMFVDVGFAHTIVTLQQNGDTIGFYVLPIGWEDLENELKQTRKIDAQALANILANIDTHYAKYSDSFQKFFDTLCGTICFAKDEIEKKFLVKNIYLFGGNRSHELQKHIQTYIERRNGNVGVLVHYGASQFDGDMHKKLDGNMPLIGLGEAGLEILASKKDPLVHILKHVIFNYE